MSKQILPEELAEIVVGLLVNPEDLGELDTPEKHRSFMLDVGKVVAEHCGGFVNGIGPGDTDERYLADEFSSPYLSVSPTDSLPCLAANVWTPYDPEGWDEEVIEGLDLGSVQSEQEVRALRERLQALLADKTLKKGGRQLLVLQMRDCAVTEGEGSEPGDEQVYTMRADLGSDALIEIADEQGRLSLGVHILVDKGVPSVNLSVGGEEALLHVHTAQGGLVLTPKNSRISFEQAALDRHAYFCGSSLVIKDSADETN